MRYPFKLGELVVSDQNPTCVQRVTRIEPAIISGKVSPIHDPMVTCVTVWRFDQKPLSGKPLKPAAAWSYRKATKAEIVAAAERLMRLASEEFPQPGDAEE